MKLYCICPPRDGLLYVDLPSPNHVLNLLLTCQFKNHANFRTIDGRTPHFGGTIAFPADYLVMLGVRPTWYVRKDQPADHSLAITQLLQDGWYEDELAAELHEGGGGDQYAAECEWRSTSNGMRFDPRMVVRIWLKDRELIESVREFAPNARVTVGRAPRGKLNPCRMGSGDVTHNRREFGYRRNGKSKVQKAIDFVADQAGFNVSWRWCREADAEHTESPRQYMHTWHDGWDGICVARAATELPIQNLVALVAHEVGHLIMGDRPGELEADRIGGEIVGGLVKYDEWAVQTIGPGVDRKTALKHYRDPL